ncbi:DNA adenine methylase [Entomospira culicis]|uniref:Site-specific DNA-methyltransferase (adenine-specific) n=1 Tax=Entomospira culicis TaxID=2719989 RepID=A0A968GKI3_9SPIO|nr:DNA adenine methylase [Entomospira culicis]NIZ19575.1 DNA adenine methylase [Entomospira culicis]NIZ69520.1 DNA adenine methylase [Entomospira culicis]WDI36633.1 DNA adenine methylase [Entomospira culicis]WDI38262.1 DNA adenine methylase [Entomospira culicis]
MQPVVKWAGGKRQLLRVLELFLPKEYSRYVEPFAGGAAMFFYLEPKQALINDLNDELMNVYQVIRDEVDALVVDLARHQNSKEYFYSLRSVDRAGVFAELSDVERASRFLYLNRTCYNGLYRVNKKGQFNTPYGYYKNPSILNEGLLRGVHRYFKENDIQFFTLNFAQFFAQATLRQGDFVYLDPPYDPFESESNFVQYQASGFGREEQLQLKQICDTLTEKGVKFLLSNSATPYILDLYKDYHLEVIKARRIIACQTNRRGAIDEVVVRNYLE